MKIKEWALEDRPREKLYQKGAKQLTNAELLAIVLATGTKSMSAVELAKSILQKAGNNVDDLAAMEYPELLKIKGVGPVKALTIKAVMELSNRRQIKDKKHNKITCSYDAYSFLRSYYKDLKVEQFWVLYLNRANCVINIKKMSEGGVSGTVVDPKVIFHHALAHLASGIILSHNHPSGNLKPSQADMAITRKISEAAKNLDIVLNDHLIISDDAYYSFMDEGKM